MLCKYHTTSFFLYLIAMGSTISTRSRGTRTAVLGRRRTPDGEGWRMEEYRRVRPFKDEFRRQTEQISESRRRRFNIQNLDPNPDILVKIWFLLIIYFIDFKFSESALSNRSVPNFWSRSKWCFFPRKRRSVFPMVSWPAFRMRQYRINDHPHHLPQFTRSRSKNFQWYQNVFLAMAYRHCFKLNLSIIKLLKSFSRCCYQFVEMEVKLEN